MRKCISISDSDLALLNEYKKENHIKSDSQAIASLIRQEKESLVSSIAVAVWDEFEKRCAQTDPGKE